MKKILALVIAAIMILTAVSALATESKENEDIAQGSTNVDGLDMDTAEDNEGTSAIKDAIKEAAENGDAIDGLPDEVKDQLPDGFATINDMETFQLDGDFDAAEEPIILTFKFETPYEEGEKVVVAIGIVPPEGEAEWLVKEGEGNADGAVEVEVTIEELNKISDNPFVVIPVSE